MNNTNITSIPALPSNLLTQQFFAKGGGAKGLGGDSLGDFFGALGDTFDLLSGMGSNASPSNIAPHGDFDEHPNATLRLWLGPLGGCLASMNVVERSTDFG